MLATVPVADRALLDETVAAASRAFPAWASTPMEARQAVVVELGNLVTGKVTEFADLLIKEVGKNRELAYVFICGDDRLDQRLNATMAS